MADWYMQSFIGDFATPFLFKRKVAESRMDYVFQNKLRFPFSHKNILKNCQVVIFAETYCYMILYYR